MLATIFCSFIIVLYRSAIFRSISNGKANEKFFIWQLGRFSQNNVSSDKTIFVGAKLHSQVKSDTLSDTPKRVSNGAENRNLSIISPQTLSRHDSCAAWKKNRRAIGSLTENWANLISHCFYHKLIRFAFVVASACSRKLAARSSYFYLRNF